MRIVLCFSCLGLTWYHLCTLDPEQLLCQKNRCITKQRRLFVLYINLLKSKHDTVWHFFCEAQPRENFEYLIRSVYTFCVTVIITCQHGVSWSLERFIPMVFRRFYLGPTICPAPAGSTDASRLWIWRDTPPAILLSAVYPDLPVCRTSSPWSPISCPKWTFLCNLHWENKTKGN